MQESERARLLRQAILDIVIDTINQRTGGGTKYINQRDEDFLQSWFEEENYRKQFTDALRDCVDMGNFKYPMYTNKIYVSIFREKAQEYRKIVCPIAPRQRWIAGAGRRQRQSFAAEAELCGLAGKPMDARVKGAAWLQESRFKTGP